MKKANDHFLSSLPSKRTIDYCLSKTLSLPSIFYRYLSVTGIGDLIEVFNALLCLVYVVNHAVDTYSWPAGSLDGLTADAKTLMVEIILNIIFLLNFLVNFFISENRVTFSKQPPPHLFHPLSSLPNFVSQGQLPTLIFLSIGVRKHPPDALRQTRPHLRLKGKQTNLCLLPACPC